jgi:hypothetical protein
MGQPPPPPPQPPLPCTPRPQPQRRVGRDPRERRGPRSCAHAREQRLATPQCGARPGSPASACSPRWLASFCLGVRVSTNLPWDQEPHQKMPCGRGPARRTQPGRSQSPHQGGRAKPGSGSRPRGSSGDSIPRARHPHSELLLLASMSVIIVSGVAGPLH